MVTRRFQDTQARRERVPLLCGLMGPSGGGKTYSALRLATGMREVTGGEIYMIDTESRRGLHYADLFDFRHLEFQAPFSPLDYLSAIEHCVSKGARIVIVDSTSHEHEGPGGVLDWHDKILDQLAGRDQAKRARMTFAAWAAPKQARRQLINRLLQLGCDGIFCFRAKEKLSFQTGKAPKELGWMPIAGEEFLFEMTVNCLLPPGANGVPEWNPERPGERAMVKLPEQFRPLFANPAPLDEAIGEQMARWAMGDSEPEPPADHLAEELKQMLFAIGEAADWDEVRRLLAENRDLAWTEDQRQVIRSAAETRRDEVAMEPPPEDEERNAQATRDEEIPLPAPGLRGEAEDVGDGPRGNGPQGSGPRGELADGWDEESNGSIAEDEEF